MPSYTCRKPTCNAIIKSPGFCEKHGNAKTARDPRAKTFYDSAEWRHAREWRLSHYPVCERCHNALATIVHHKLPLLVFWEMRATHSNLLSLCAPCHNIIEKRGG